MKKEIKAQALLICLLLHIQMNGMMLRHYISHSPSKPKRTSRIIRNIKTEENNNNIYISKKTALITGLYTYNDITTITNFTNDPTIALFKKKIKKKYISNLVIKLMHNKEEITNFQETDILYKDHTIVVTYRDSRWINYEFCLKEEVTNLTVPIILCQLRDASDCKLRSIYAQLYQHLYDTFPGHYNTEIFNAIKNVGLEITQYPVSCANDLITHVAHEEINLLTFQIKIDM